MQSHFMYIKYVKALVHTTSTGTYDGHSLKHTNPSWQLKTVFPKVRLVDHQRVYKEKMRKFNDAMQLYLIY